MSGPTVLEGLRWSHLEIAGEAALGTLDVRIGEAGSGGPVALLTAGVHGDEGPWGALALRAALDVPVGGLSGRVRVAFAANPLAAQADARNAPLDTLDLNRTFPGNPAGSHTERVAAALATHLEDVDVVVDLHGGGSWCVNAFVFRVAGSEDLADLVAAPFVVDAPDKPGTLTQYARSQGAKVIAIEMGGRSRDEVAWSERIAGSVRRILAASGVLDAGALDASPSDASPRPPAPVRASEVLRPPAGGVFVPTLREDAVGTVVAGGTELGRVYDMRSMDLVHTFLAPFPRTALMLLRPHVCSLEGGAMTYVVAQPIESEVS